MTMESATYWQNRAVRFGHRDRGLPAVCSFGMPRLYNEAIHACQRRALAPWLDRCEDLDVLDVGCGVGRWSLPLARRGNRVVGIDISSRMVDFAAAAAGSAGLDCEFLVRDATSLDLCTDFDLVLSVTVLQHILELERLQAAVANLARHLRPGGTLVLLEVAPNRAVDRCDSEVFRTRSLGDYERLLASAGLEIEQLAGVDIAPVRPVLLPAMAWLPAPLARTLVTASALLSLPFDLTLSRALPSWCWHKVIVARRA